MDTLNHKSEKIHHLLTKAKGRKINLHEIKAKTGAGNGLKPPSTASSNINSSTNTNSSASTTFKNDTFIPNESLAHKSERINHFIENTVGKINLHHIKAKTGAGNGFKDHNTNSSSTDDYTLKTNNPDFLYKSEKIHDAVSNTEGKVNLHDIKAKTGAGSGFKHH